MDGDDPIKVVDNLISTLGAFNAALADAHVAGLWVEIDTRYIETIGNRHRQVIVGSEVSKPPFRKWFPPTTQ